MLHVHHEFELVMSSPVTRNDYGTMRDDRDGDRQTELLMLRLKRAEAQAGGMAMLHPSKGMPETYHSMDDLESCQHQQETIPERKLCFCLENAHLFVYLLQFTIFGVL